MNGEKINLWLDDVRPAPIGWLHVKTVGEAKPYLVAGLVKRASLDHDLGACPGCSRRDGESAEEWLLKHGGMAMPNCEHFGTGYTLVCWMEETGHWPDEKPAVHSANPVGAARMRRAIDRRFGS